MYWYVYYLLNLDDDIEDDDEDLEEWRTIFNLFDVDGDQAITKEVIL